MSFSESIFSTKNIIQPVETISLRIRYFFFKSLQETKLLTWNLRAISELDACVLTLHSLRTEELSSVRASSKEAQDWILLCDLVRRMSSVLVSYIPATTLGHIYLLVVVVSYAQTVKSAWKKERTQLCASGDTGTWNCLFQELEQFHRNCLCSTV